MRFLTLLLLASLGGCSVQIKTNSTFVQAFGLAMVGIGMYQYESARNAAPAPAPELAADRTVSEQDCTRPVDPSGGNLRCK